MTDIASDTSTTATVSVGGSATGEIESAGDKDWFAVDLVAGRTYRFDLQGASGGHGTLADTFLRRILDADGNKSVGDGQHRTYNDDFGDSHDSQVTFTATESGRYYVEASGDRDETGTYTLTVADVTPEPQESTQPQALQETSEEEDGDATPPAEPVTDVPDEAEEQEEAAAPLVSPEQSSGDYPRSTATTATVAVGGSATGEIESAGDKDWFAVDLVAGRTYRFDLQGAPGGHGTLADTFLRRILDAEGNKSIGDGQHRTYNDDFEGSLESRVTFTATESGRYYVEASGDRDETGTYTLMVTDVTPESQESTQPQARQETSEEEEQETAAPLVSPESSSEEEEQETVAPLVSPESSSEEEEQETAAPLVSPESSSEEEEQETAVPLVSPESSSEEEEQETAAPLVSPESSSEEEEQETAAPLVSPERSSEEEEATEEEAQQGATAQEDDGTPLQVVTVTIVPAEQEVEVEPPLVSLQQSDGDLAHTTATTGTVAVDGSVEGEIDHSCDRDWYAVDLVAGTVYRFDLEGSSTGAGTLDDPYTCGIYGSDGNRIPLTWDADDGVGLNSRLQYTPSASGRYYISAGVTYADRLGTYKLSVTNVSASDVQTDGTDTTGVIEVGESVTGTIDYVRDTDWYKVDDLVAGTTYRVDMEGASTGAGTLPATASPEVGVYDSSGNGLVGTFDKRFAIFVAPESGSYYLSAGAFSNYWSPNDFSPPTGTYKLSVKTYYPSDDYAVGTGTTGTVAVNGSTTGMIDYAGDRDWFAVTLKAGATYRILQEYLGDPIFVANTRIFGVHDEDGNLIPNTADTSWIGRHTTSEVEFRATKDGVHYISVGSRQTKESGNYKVTVTLLSDPDTQIAGTDTTGEVAVDGSVQGVIDFAGDRDWFEVDLLAGTVYRLYLDGGSTLDGGLSNPYLHGIHDVDGNLVAGTTDDDSGVGRDSERTFTPATAGTYYVSVGANGDGTGTYTLSVSIVTASDSQTAGTDTTGVVAVDGSVTDQWINFSGDQDWFKVTLTANTIYRIDLDGAATRDGTLCDPYLRGIYDVDGDLVAGTADNDSGRFNNSEKTFTPTVGGTYYVSVGANGNGVGTYALSVTNATAADTVSAAVGTTGAVAVDESVTGIVDYAGDVDWYRVTLTAGTTYRIYMDAGGARAGGLRDPYLQGIYDADSNLIEGTADDNGGRGLDSETTFTPTVGGSYYVSASGNGSETGSFELSVDEVL